MNVGQQNLIFLISLPRSGSTLLQRLLSINDSIVSTAESWLLLPVLYSDKEGKSFAEYSHTTASRAIRDFIDVLPNGKEDYLESVAAYYLTNIGKITPAKKFYLEKTPRNNLVLSDLIAMFPQAKYIFLWRNPAAVLASMIESFSGGKWNAYHYHVDLYSGLENMIESRTHRSLTRIDINYEELVTNPDVIMSEISDFLDIDFDAGDLDKLGDSNFKGRMGDPTGTKKYKSVSADSLATWSETFSNSFRKKWVCNYLQGIGKEQLSAIGYDMDELIAQIGAEKNTVKQIPSDLLRMAFGRLDGIFQFALIKRYLKYSSSKRKVRLQ